VTDAQLQAEAGVDMVDVNATGGCSGWRSGPRPALGGRPRASRCRSRCGSWGDTGLERELERLVTA
jgi:hypothetical protein